MKNPERNLSFYQTISNLFAHKEVSNRANLETFIGIDILRGYLKGINREKPDVAREFPQKFKNEYLYKKEIEPEWLIQERSKLVKFIEGYRLGFIAGIAAEFNITLGFLDVPTDDLAYKAFMAGLQAETRSLPAGLGREGHKYDPQDFYSVQIEAQEMHDYSMYQSGLKVWLHNQDVDSITPVEIELISRPEGLEAFKAGLFGEDIKVEKELSLPLDLEKVRSRMAYELGKKARKGNDL